ncbi:MAG TPA: hypothetical protein VMU11_02935 [Verrucomicrobiae bacterium]|nr:hypothetical protein [Verrucomicrobiae bacterium]
MPRKHIKKPHPHHVPLAIVMMVCIVFLLTLALLFVWNLFPHTPAHVPPPIGTSTIPVVPAIPEEPAATTTPPVVQAPTGPVREAPPGMICDSLNYICVDPSFAKDALTSPFVATGTIAYEGEVGWQLLTNNGSVMTDGVLQTTTTDASGVGSFTLREFLWADIAPTGTLQFFTTSTKDGLPIHVVSIPVTFPKGAQTVHIACNGKQEMSMAKTRFPIEASEWALLNGYGLRMESLTLSQGTLTIHTFQTLNDVQKACVEATAKQFSSVKNVVIQP